MDREGIENGWKKAAGTIKEQAGKPIGDRHLKSAAKAEKAERSFRSGAMDAAREVVNEESEGKADKAERRIRSDIGKEMDAVREVVNEEKK